MGFFYKSNIHPYRECLRRQQTLEDYAEMIDLRLIYQQDYDLDGFLQNVVFRESRRCELCYHDRLKATALIAKRGKFDYFTSTLLYSKFQRQDLIQSIGESIGKAVGVPFLYQDFRIGWKRGIAESKRLQLYRQQYCGCIYSEKERYYQSSSGEQV
jgi:predicted adenine nucleotide alpha hydrolase (AANH) superfamily ATPase